MCLRLLLCSQGFGFVETENNFLNFSFQNKARVICQTPLRYGGNVDKGRSITLTVRFTVTESFFAIRDSVLGASGYVERCRCCFGVELCHLLKI